MEVIVHLMILVLSSVSSVQSMINNTREDISGMSTVKPGRIEYPTESTVMVDGMEVRHFKVGLLAPWKMSFDDFSALTSASAISIAIEAIHSDPTLNTRMRFR